MNVSALRALYFSSPTVRRLYLPFGQEAIPSLRSVVKLLPFGQGILLLRPFSPQESNIPPLRGYNNRGQRPRSFEGEPRVRKFLWNGME